MNLYKQCGRLFRHYPSQKDTQSCGRDFITLAVDGEIYDLTRPHGLRPKAYGLFPHGKYAGYGSFAWRNGEFTRHGAISLADFERIVTRGKLADSS